MSNIFIMSKIKERKKIALSDIGLYLRLIYMDYSPQNNEETAKLITEHFNIECLAEDIEQYEALFIEQEDYEKLSRMVENGNTEHLIE